MDTVSTDSLIEYSESLSFLAKTLPQIDISVIIPVYNSQESLPELYHRVVRVLSYEKYNFEILFVDDCSNDESWKVVQALCMEDRKVHGFRMNRNYGQHNALLAGIRAAQGRVIVTMDDDLQHPPEEIPRLLSKLKEGYDVVYGSPDKEKHGFLRNVASQITKLALQGGMGVKAARDVSAFRVFRTELRHAFGEYKSPTLIIDVLLSWATTRFTAISVTYEKRKHGESGYTTRKLINHAINMITGFSTLPLKLASIIGFLFSFFGLIVLAKVVLYYLFFGSTVKGFTFLASIVALFSGAQLLALGLIGEYLARMYQKTMEKPTYFIMEKMNNAMPQKLRD